MERHCISADSPSLLYEPFVDQITSDDNGIHTEDINKDISFVVTMLLLPLVKPTTVLMGD